MGPLVLLLITLLQINGATSYWIYEFLNVTQWQWQSSVVVDDWVYIDGGELYAIENGEPAFFYLGQTISVDLSKSWTNLTVQKYSNDTQRPVTDGHWSKRPSLFYDTHKNQVVQWGGWPYDNGDVSYEFSFTPNTAGAVNWSKNETPVTDSLDPSAASPAVFGAAFVASNTSFYSLGGIVAETSAPPDDAIQGLVEYEFASGEWTNTSSTNATSNGYLVGAQAAYTPGSSSGGFGRNGFLVFVGGSDSETQLFDPQAPALIDMSNITLYDIAAQTWYHQTAAGTIPPPRQFFCSVAATSIQATFEIFILGGSTNSTWDQNHPNDTDYLNVFTLSIPAFRWFKSTDSDQVRRADHSCQLLGNKQMLVIGGTQPSSPLGIAATDPWPSGLGVFDMSAFAWSHEYDPAAAPYEQPETVKNYYTYDYQAPTWDEPGLEPIFAWAPPDLPTGTYSGTYTVATGTSPISGSASTSTSAPISGSASTSTSAPIPTPKPSTNHSGAIIGGAVGGGCALVLLLLLIYLFRKRHLKNKISKSTTTIPETFNNKEHLGPDSLVFAKSELETPLHSPDLSLPTDQDNEASGRPVEVQSPEPSSSPLPEIDGQVHRHSIRRKPVAELP